MASFSRSSSGYASIRNENLFLTKTDAKVCKKMLYVAGQGMTGPLDHLAEKSKLR
jgi:hypothetical protein